MPEISAIEFFSDGMNCDISPANLDQSQVARAVNVQIRGQRATTRPGIEALSLDGDLGALDSRLQGACFYNPGRGQSGRQFGGDRPSLVLCADGELVSVELSINNLATIKRPGGATIRSDSPLAYVFQAENFIIIQESGSETLVWDGEAPVAASNGYDSQNKEESRLANLAGAGGYAHGRIVQSINGRQLIVGDIIHKDNLTDARNILNTTEQVYWATGSFFLLPSNLGEITAIGILPLQNTTHGHGDLIIHAEDGAVSLDISRYPRTEWANMAAMKHVLLQTGARGPYCLALCDGDQIFRSRHGVQTLRSAAAQSQALASPLSPISDPVSTWMESDFEPHLKHASAVAWNRGRRFFCTVSHWAEGARRGARGVVSMSLRPQNSGNRPAWEGLWTFPEGMEEVHQMVSGLCYGEDRLYGIHGNKDGEMVLVRYQDRQVDILPGGVESRISCQLISREVHAGDPFKNKAIARGSLHLIDMQGEVDFGVWVRSDTQPEWQQWRTGRVSVEAQSQCDPCGLVAAHDGAARIPLGQLPEKCREARRLQVMLRWRGIATVEGLRIDLSAANDGSDEVRECITLSKDRSCVYSDWEYRSSQNRWEDYGND